MDYHHVWTNAYNTGFIETGCNAGDNLNWSGMFTSGPVIFTFCNEYTGYRTDPLDYHNNSEISTNTEIGSWTSDANTWGGIFCVVKGGVLVLTGKGSRSDQFENLNWQWYN